MNDAQGHTQHAEPLPLTLSQALTAKAFKKEVSEPHRYGVLESQEWHIRLP
jgi:dTDP-glucose pyrophosphorylase